MPPPARRGALPGGKAREWQLRHSLPGAGCCLPSSRSRAQRLLGHYGKYTEELGATDGTASGRWFFGGASIGIMGFFEWVGLGWPARTV